MTLGGPRGTAGVGGLSLPVPPLATAVRDAGWYSFTAVPGAAGNAVIVGHVDTYAGPAVFYNLYRLRPGDPVYVDAGGTRRRFDVTSVREMPKPSFPVNQVFGRTKRHMLWLITCGGAFDDETRHYLDNIVVSATLAQPPKSSEARKSIRNVLKIIRNRYASRDNRDARLHRLNLSSRRLISNRGNTMNRVTAVAATLATAAAATMAAATIGPAMAAPRSAAGHHAAHAKTTTARARSAPAKATAKQVTQAKRANSLPTEIASELDGGKYVTVVRCQGVDSPPPVHLGKPGTPLIVSGGGPSTAISKMLKQADPYKEIYTCTVLVEEKMPANLG